MGAMFHIRKKDGAVVFALERGDTVLHTDKEPEFPLDERDLDSSTAASFRKSHDPAPGFTVGGRYKALRDLTGMDNCFNYPKRVTVKTGTTLSPVSGGATSRGHFFLRGEDGTMIDSHVGVHLYGPYGDAFFDPKVFKQIG